MVLGARYVPRGSADLHAAERGEVAPAPTPPTPEPAPPPSPVGPTADSLLSVVAAPIVKARREALEQGGETSSRYSKRVQEALAAFLEIVGDKPLRDYLPADVQEFANVLACVPSNWHKRSASADPLVSSRSGRRADAVQNE